MYVQAQYHIPSLHLIHRPYSKYTMDDKTDVIVADGSQQAVLVAGHVLRWYCESGKGECRTGSSTALRVQQYVRVRITAVSRHEGISASYVPYIVLYREANSYY